MRIINKSAVLAVLCSKARSSFALSNQTSSRMFASSRLIFQHYETTESTQDVAKENSASLKSNQILAVTAGEQTQGRGTSGRAWMGLRGNVFLTMALQSKEVPTTLTLLPLQIGVLVAERVDKLLKQACNSQDHTVHVKWPNDILLNQKKVAGVLIESKVIAGEVWLFIGVGVNLAAAPSIPHEGPNRGRPSTAVQQHCTEQQLPESTAKMFAEDLSEGLVQWLEDPTTTSRKVLTEWKTWANIGEPQVLRETGETVIPVDVKDDGQLVVRGEDGRERLLVADYLY
mmetsp:Transcript_7612/g.12646  ORF Transcript_7612/g.12646 Transcript_7612/m.12646 type:complete len:286 (+) Transcript_7612:123-980(+)